MWGEGDLWSLPSLFLPPGLGLGGGAVPLSFPSSEEAPAPKGLRSWNTGKGEGAEPDPYKTLLPLPGTMNRKDSKRKSHQECLGKTGGRGRPRQARRYKTCPSPREISKVTASMALGMLNEGGCSEDELLEKCIQSFDSAGSLRRGDHILNMVLAMHSWVLPSAHLAARLLTLYQEATGSTQESRRLQICHLVRYWLNQHPETVHQEPQLEEVIGRFWATVEQEGNSTQRSLGDSSNLLSPGGPGPPAPTNSPGLGKKRKVSLLFDHLETGELAQHLTYLEFRSFQAVTVRNPVPNWGGL